MIFEDRKDAGQKLAAALLHYAHAKDAVVVALARGGVVVASEVAILLHLPMDVLVVRKIGAPDFPEFAIGALVGDEVVLHKEVIHRYGISDAQVAQIIKERREEERHKESLYSKYSSPITLENKIVILVDDGLATGASMEVAVKYVRAKKAQKIVVAVPVSSEDGKKAIERQVDEFVDLYHPMSFMAVGQFYRVFAEVDDESVCAILEKMKREKKK